MNNLIYKNIFGNKLPVTLEVAYYEYNKASLYIGLTDVSDLEYPEPYGVLTVNLDKEVPKYCAYVDTNNCRNAEEFIAEYNLGTFTGLVATSGFCTYPLYQFDADKLRELCSDGMQLYESMQK